MMNDRPIRVLVVDDSAIVRKILVEALSKERGIEVVGTASDPYFARDRIVALRPDVLTLDIEMPRMDGLTFLKKLMQYHPMPVIVVSSLAQSSCAAAVEALRLGAAEVVAKPSGPYSVGELSETLAGKVRAAAASRPAKAGPAVPSPAPQQPASLYVGSHARSSIVAIGASTGGVSALQKVLSELPEDMPGIVVTQHIPADFSLAFATRLNQVCRLTVKEAEDGDSVLPGHVYIAPGNRHLILQKGSAGYRLALKDGPQVCYQRPSVDVLFHSVAQAAGAKAVGVLLTGMGADGADGLLAMKRSGARTIAQDEASCVVFGMPKEAILRGAVDEIKSLCDIGRTIQSCLSVRQ
ncbi:MAG TPA: chemotaxis response regulator protein-glutamate methylesterase [Bryobacteraceae bacterium]